jgi:hypothetical protein
MAILNEISGISIPSITNVAQGPLAALFGKKTQMNQYKYPMDLGNDPSRMHIVKFDFYKIIPKQFDVKKTLNAAVEKTKDAANTTLNDPKKALEQAKNNAVAGFAKAADVAQNLQAYLKPEMKQVTTSVSLYMPDTLSMSYNAEYNELNLMDATNGLNRVAGAAGSLVEDLVKGGMTTDGVMNALSSTIDKYGPEVALRFADKKLGTNITDLGLAAMGKAINPQVQLLFKGITFRTFSMEFLFTPKSKEESDQVSAIVNTFIYASMPEVESSTKGMYFLPPSVLEMKFLTSKTGNFSDLGNMLVKAGNGIIQGVPFGSKLDKFSGSVGPENDRLFKVGKCVLENVSVDYAPNGWAAYNNGAPVQTRLNLSFKEIDILDRSRMRKGEAR